MPVNACSDVHCVLCRVQLLGDSSRGWAWTRALQGLPANEIHLCGDGSAIPLVRKLAAAMGEPVEVREYQRFTPVEVGCPLPLLMTAPSSLLHCNDLNVLYQLHCGYNKP